MKMIDWRSIPVLALAACGPAPADRGTAQPETAAVAVEPHASARAQRPAAMRQSVYTKLDPAACKLVEEDREAGGWLRRCAGHAGWQLDWRESDLRQGLILIGPNRRKTELQLSSLVANGAFNSLGSTIEWRGRNIARPEALIVRMGVANGAAPEQPDISKLAVVRLTRTPCLVAIVEPGPTQNQKARDFADGQMPTCISKQ